MVYPYIAAPNGFSKNLTKKQWVKLGKTLRHIHTLPVPIRIQKKLKKETFPPKWRVIVRSFYGKIESNTLDDKITENFKSFFKQNINIIQQLVDSAE